MDYEIFEPLDDTPERVAYSRMFNGFYYNPRPAYAMEVQEEDETIHQIYYRDVVSASAG